MAFRKYPNTEGIEKLEFTVKVSVFCPLGGTYSTMMVECEVELGDTYIDMLDLEHYFAKELNGQPLTQEALTAEVYATLKREFNSPFVCVRAHGSAHLDAYTTKSDKRA